MLTRKQQDYYVYWSKTGFDPNRRKECMVAAGYSEKTPPSLVENSTRLRHIIERSMARNGLTPDRVCEKLAEKLECTDPQYEKPDNKNQLRALDLTCKLGDFYPSQKFEVRKREEFVRLDMVTVRLAEELSGEKILDAEIVEEKQIAPFGSGPDDAL